MVEWTDEALSAAIKAYGDARTVVPSLRDDWMRAALDAAVKAQGMAFESFALQLGAECVARREREMAREGK